MKPSSSSQEALLRLEKGSSASPTTQLHEAAQILGVDLKTCESHPETHRDAKIQTKATPKEEWVLRWLLKRLRTGKNYRVDPASFLLLRQLIGLISPKNLATILKDQKFFSILCDTVTDLENDIFATLGSGAPTSSFESDSSNTMDAHPTQGTKRKRVVGENDTESMDLDETPQNPASCFLAFIRALDCLYGVVTLAQRTLGVDEVANSHLKLALRGEPEVVANLLGRSLQMAAVAVTQFSQAGKTTDLQHLLLVFPAMLELWESRSYRQDDTNNNSSNDWFAKSCFSHALRLQLCLRSIRLDTAERAHLLHAIERIVALHVLIPAREAFFARGGSGIDYSKEEPDWSSVKPVTDTFRPIIGELSVIQMTPEKSGSRSFHPSWRSIELLPELFDNAVRAVPRDDFRRQTHEARWLETLFVAVAELAYSTAKEEEPATFSARFVSVLEDLLRIALDRSVGLSLPTILTHAGYTGLLEQGLEQVQWNVTALVISLGVDVFLPNSGLRDASKLLDALLDKIMLQWRSDSSKNTKDYNTIKNDIVIPLLRGFAGARDLTSFMEVWHDQLVILEEARVRNDSLPFFSVWEDDDLCDVFSELTRTSLTGANFAAQLQTAATATRGDNGKISQTSSSYAKFVVMEATFRSKVLTTDSEEILAQFLETLTSTLSSKQIFHWRWRLWRFVRNLLQDNLLAAGSVLDKATKPLVSIAAKSLHRNHKNLTKTPLAPLESWEIYRFALLVIKEKPSDEQLEAFTDISKDITKLLSSITTEDSQASMEAPWDGRIDTLCSPTTLALAYTLALVREPDAWEKVKPEYRSSLFKQLMSLAAAQYHSSSLPLETVADNARFLQAWASVVCHEYLLNVPFIVPDLVLLLTKSMEDDVSNRRLSVESMQRIPAALVTRGLRTSLLDKMHDIVVQQDIAPEVTLGLLTMMAKLAAMPKCDANVTSDWEPIWTEARAISLDGTDLDLQIMKAFRSLYRAVIAKLLVLSQDDRYETFKKLYSRVSKQASKLRQIDRDSMACFLLRLSLSELWVHRKELAKAFSEDDLASCRQRVFGLVLADMKSVKDQCRKQKLEETITLIKTIDALEDFEDLATNNIEVEKFLSKLERYMEMSIDSAPSRLIRRRLMASKGSEKKSTEPMLQCAETLTLQSLYAEDQQLFIRATTERFRSMSGEHIGEAIQEIRELGFSGQHAAYRLLVVYLAVISLQPVEGKDSPISRELSQLSQSLATTLVHSTSIDQFCFTAETIALLLRVHTRSMAQCNVDDMLAAIATAASKSGPRISPEYAPTIYTRLCRLMGIILGLQRVKIGGRFHLVVTAMQRLLGCLFARSRKRYRTNRAAVISHPFWLAPLGASHTSNFTRLLTSLSDPTVSAVLRSQPGMSREALTDETKKAKRIAGQYLQYVIMSYAQCSLRGSLVADVKAALMPGLYAALDVMSRESMRAMNAGLDASGRAVFKSLYDDYVKFGKWNKA
jgi:nucleolar pre-ribosomal-associated protein 2